ncbi:ABC transporter ATP-binding protein [Solicola gregarius]|uniref:ABC transporter ATP-binding protein n=1 Tax=Solicola gregarius TaxID=2908642 RepID=A0AA46TM24_9ACTN|nr:ABC transporter ATP-binding protein [Solicola gregarius]UYM07623.1 ABC transporter ATP-binding protein [Solicola gregarius]
MSDLLIEVAHAVAVEGVTKTYGSEQQPVVALDDVTIDFAARTFTAVMGPSGSGKSTLMHCAAGLERPDAGIVRIGGTDLGPLNERRRTELRRRQVGFVFQAFNLVASLTAQQNVALPLRLDGKRPRQETVLAALDAVGLGDRAGHRPAELSGGQQQRVALARALVTEPTVLFADEPTGALDLRSSREVLRRLRDLVDESGQTVITVTHDPIVAAAADRIVFLADGRIVDDVRTRMDASTIATRMTHLEDR